MDAQRFALLKEVFEQKIAFNKVIGMELVSAADGKASLRFDMKPELVGNFNLKILHGGVSRFPSRPLPSCRPGPARAGRAGSGTRKFPNCVRRSR